MDTIGGIFAGIGSTVGAAGNVWSSINQYHTAQDNNDTALQLQQIRSENMIRIGGYVITGLIIIGIVAIIIRLAK